jgi:S1-C subfamily serine protease
MDFVYNIGKKYARFQAIVGVDDAEEDGKNSVTFQVEGDGKSLFRSPPMRAGDPPVSVDVSVTGMVRLKLMLLGEGGYVRVKGIWADARLIKGPGGGPEELKVHHGETVVIGGKPYKINVVGSGGGGQTGSGATDVALPPRAVQSFAQTLAEKAQGNGQAWQRVAVARFKCVPPLAADAPVALALQEDLLTAINQNGVNTVERGELERILEEHKIATTGLIDSASAKELGKFLQADAVLVGSLSDRGESVVINARWIDLQTGEAPAGASATQEVSKVGVRGQKWLGFDARDLTANEKAELGATAGVYVVGVTADGPADNANLRQGDVVTAFGGRAIGSLQDLVAALETLPVGEPISFRYVRKGMERDDVMKVEDAALRGEVVRF